jgi:FemAB-related protein (PEP-CTERM system-associated)
MQVTLLDSSNIHKWEKYVENHPDATFYHRYEWKQVIEKSFGHKTYYLMANDNDEVTGILPMVHLKSFLFGSIFCSMPFLNFGGICADNGAAEDALLTEARQILKTSGGSYLELRHKKKSNADIPAKTHKVSMTLELDSNSDVLWNNFKTKQRQNIRRAYKNKLEIKVGKRECLMEFYKIMSIGWRDLGTPFYRLSFFENIFDAFSDAVEIFLVYHDGRPIATAFIGLFRDTVEGMWTYSLREFAILQTNYLLYWEMIKRACEKEYKLFHLGRSTSETGATFYKKKWNAVTKQLYWEYVLNKESKVPDLTVDNPKYDLAIKVWKNLPVAITRLIGPSLAKSIP